MMNCRPDLFSFIIINNRVLKLHILGVICGQGAVLVSSKFRVVKFGVIRQNQNIPVENSVLIAFRHRLALFSLGLDFSTVIGDFSPWG